MTNPLGATLISEASRSLSEMGIDTARLDAELLLAAAWGTDRTGLVLRRDHAVPEAVVSTFHTNLQRRLASEPVAYILEEREFWSLPFKVGPAVLVPRPETELLVEQALAACGLGRERICDVGTGSGCVAISLATELPDAEIVALDLSKAALEIAHENARRHAVEHKIEFCESDLMGAIDTMFDLIVSNPPYLASAEIDAAQRDISFEPRRALDGGPDGLDVVRRLVAEAEPALVPGGCLLMEIGCDQGAAVRSLLSSRGWSDVAVIPDLAGLDRVVRGRWSNG